MAAPLSGPARKGAIIFRQMKKKTIIKIVLLALVLLAPPAARAQKATFQVIPPELALANFQKHWESFRDHMSRNEFARAKVELQAALESKWDGDLGDLEVHAMALVIMAEKQHKSGKADRAEALLDYALKLAPGSYALEMSLGRYFLGGSVLDPQKALTHYLEAYRKIVGDFPALHRMMARHSIMPLLFLAIAGLVFTVMITARYAKLLRSDFSTFFPEGNLPRVLEILLILALLLLPTAAGLSIWWQITWWLLVFSLYMNKIEITLVFLWIALLFGAPILLTNYARLESLKYDRVLGAVLRVRDGAPLPEDISILRDAVDQDPDNAAARFSLATLLQRRGNFTEAHKHYKKLFRDERVSQEAYNNISEIYYAVGDTKSMGMALHHAAEIGPARAEIFYNLIVYYNLQRDGITTADEYRARARDIDAATVDFWNERAVPDRLNRQIAKLDLPGSIIGELGRKGSALGLAAYQGVWTRWMGPPRGLPFLAANTICLFLLFLITISRRRWKISYRCSSCGIPICDGCPETSIEDPKICSHCYQVFKGSGSVELKVKMQKRAEVQRYRDIWSWSGQILSIVLPGSGHLLFGFTVAGIILFSFTAMVFAGFLSAYLVWPAAVPSYSGGVPAHVIVLVLVYLILMIVSILLFRRKADNWG